MSRATTQEKQKNKVPLKQLKEIITILLVMNRFLNREKGKEMMTVFRGEFRKIRASTYEGEVNMGENAKEWLLGMSKYFQVHNYSSVMQARLGIYSLNGKAARWWRDLKHTKKYELREIRWENSEIFSQKNTCQKDSLTAR